MTLDTADRSRPPPGPEDSDSRSTLEGNGNDRGEKSEIDRTEDKRNGDEEDSDLPPLPVGFWDSSLNKVRLEVFKNWAFTTLGLFVFILTVLSLYWAVLFHVQENMAALKVAVVSFDAQSPPYTDTKPLIGRAVEQAAKQQALVPKGAIGFEVHPPSEFDFDPIAVRQAVYDEHYWAAIIVNSNATGLLQQAVSQGNRTYDPLGAMQVVYVQARDETTYANYITPQLNQFTTNIQAQFGEQWISQVLSNTSLDPAIYSRAPQALSPAIGVSTFNLRPFEPPQATPAVTIGLIYLIIIAFFSFAFYLPVHTKFLIPQGHPPLHFYQLVLWRLLATTFAYFLLSLAYSLVSLAFQIPFNNHFPHNDVSVTRNPDAFGRSTFLVYWMLNFVGMFALGLASENVSMLIGQPWTALWLIFWVISNVSTSFYAIQLAPRFFYWGWAWPLQQIVTASRTILFDTHSRLGLNFGILFAWCAVHVALFPICCLFMRWMSNKEMAEKVPRSKIKYLVDG